MKASEEIAADLFIRNCIDRGITAKSAIIKEASKGDGTGSSQVAELMEKRKSVAYEEIRWEECNVCETDMMYDDSVDEYYCPRCES